METRQHPAITVERLQSLFAEIAKLMVSSLHVSAVMEAIMEQIELFFQPKNCSLFRLDQTTQELLFYMAKGIDAEAISHVHLKLGEGVAGKVALSGQPMFVPDAQQDPYFSKKIDKITGFTTKSLIAAPMIFQGKVLGVIELINTLDDHPFNQSELLLLKVIADFGAIALSNAMIYERAVFLAMRDPLTSLYNRTYLTNVKTLNERRDQARSYIIVVVVDIDHFKEVNDVHGHRVGDEVLCKTASLLQACCREEDYAFRTGGDEFLLVVMYLYQHEVQETMARLQQQLRQASQQIAPATGFSFGMVSGLKKDMHQLLEAADKKMYEHKTHVGY